MNNEAFLTWTQMMTSFDKMRRKGRIEKKAEAQLKKNGFFFLLSIR